MKSKIFITGSSGFIGFHTAIKYLKKGHIVHGFDSMNNYYDVKLKHSRLKILRNYKKFSFTKANICNQKILNKVILKFNPSIIIHLAAQAGIRYSVKKPKTYLDTNINGSYNILEISKKIKIKHLIIGSSSSVYGENLESPSKEIHKTDHQISFYAATKKSVENIAHSYSSLWKIPITMLRFFTVYGPFGRPDMAYFKFTKKILAGEKISLNNKGKMYRDFTYIDDIVDGIFRITKKSPNKKNIKKFNDDSLSKVAPFRILNIGNANKIYLLDFINFIEIELGKKARKELLPMQKGDVQSTFSNSKLLKQITGYKPIIDYKTGIKRFIRWYLKFYN